MKFKMLSSGGLIPTYCCSSACAHCLYSCRPKLDASYIDRATGYNNPCDLCHAIRKYLTLEQSINSQELQPVEFYES
jgi:hypothetical protein